jgi:hypothetical protein
MAQVRKIDLIRGLRRITEIICARERDDDAWLNPPSDWARGQQSAVRIRSLPEHYSFIATFLLSIERIYNLAGQLQRLHNRRWQRVNGMPDRKQRVTVICILAAF